MITMSKSRILLIYTGGTIGMEVDPEDGSLAPLPFDRLLSYTPELSKLECELDIHSFPDPIDSSEANPEFWNDIARIVKENYDQYDGFVVLHGTDTMAYTASALSIMMENLNKPIVVTGSQLPMGSLRTDGRENLISSIEIASLKAKDGLPILQEVAVYFEYSLYRGNRCHKFSSEHFDAIISPNYPPLAETGVNIHWNMSALQRKSSDAKFDVNYKWSNEVATIKIFPGVSYDQLFYQFGQPGVKVFVLETYGSGNIPMRSDILNLIKLKIKEGRIVINASQCTKGKVDQKTYASGLQLSKMGVISSEDMTLESVLVKSMFLLGQGISEEAFKKEFEIAYSGELTM